MFFRFLKSGPEIPACVRDMATRRIELSSARFPSIECSVFARGVRMCEPSSSSSAADTRRWRGREDGERYVIDTLLPERRRWSVATQLATNRKRREGRIYIGIRVPRVAAAE